MWRNSLAIMTALAIVGFALFPLMPPRLLDEPCAEYGGGVHRERPATCDGERRSASSTRWPSTAARGRSTPRRWHDISNQYAAMPSMHIGWSTWCAVAMWPLLRRRWQRVAVFLYPMATLFCIIVTGNHYWIDGVGGLLALGVGIVVGWGLHRWNTERLDRRAAAPGTL